MYLTRIDHGVNLYRYYRMDIVSGLFGDWGLVRAWGRIGRGGQKRKIKEAALKRYHYNSNDQLRTHLGDFMAAYNFAHSLKAISDLTPYEYICKIWTSAPD